MESLLSTTTLIALIEKVGYLGLFLTLFLECGFPVTFFLPGDSLLFTTGFLASVGILNIFILIPVLFIAAVLGYTCNYIVSRAIGEKIFTNEKSFWFNPKHLLRARQFFDKYGGKTIILGRFVPVVRSFAPAVAGAAGMSYKKFTAYNLIGGVVWSIGMTTVGFYLGRMFPNAHLYLTPIILAIVFISIIPALIEYYLQKRKRKEL